MEKNKERNELYFPPTVTVVEMKQEGVICQSLTDLTDYPGGIDPFNP